jgi:hypothetical protein
MCLSEQYGTLLELAGAQLSADIRQGISKLYRFILQMLACVLVSAIGRVDPSVNGSSSPSARRANFSTIVQRYFPRPSGGSDAVAQFVPTLEGGGRSMSALDCISDSRQTSRYVRKPAQ